MKTKSKRWVSAAVVSLCGLAAMAEPGVDAKTITLGQSAALKGPAEALGTGMQAGLNAYFKHANAAGGFNGRTVDLKTLNDSYEPEKCQVATETLIDKMGVFAMIGGVGTPTSKVAVPVCTERQVPFIGAFTGAGLLRDPFNKYVVNLRASYNQETEALANFLVTSKGAKSVACFYQNDAYGQAGLSGITAALDRRQMKLAATGTYERNTVAVAEAISKLAAGKPDAVVMVGAYKACAEFIKQAKANEAFKNTTFCNISFVGTEALLSELGPVGEGVIVSQVVPSPWDTTILVVKEYAAAMQAAGTPDKTGYVSFEGYLVGKMFGQVITKIEGEPTREKFIETLYKVGSFDLGGFSVKFTEGHNQGSDAVFLTTFEGGKVKPISGAVVATGSEK